MSTNRGVRQDFPLRNDVSINKVDIRSGFVKPTYPALIHPDGIVGVALTDADVITNPVDLLGGFYFESATLTAGRTLTLPAAVDAVSYLITTLKSSTANIPGTRFIFSLDNTQAGAFTRTLVAGAGVTLQGSGFDVAMGEVAIFSVFVDSSTTVVVSRSNLGPSTVSTLAETLAAGNTTGGTDIEITGGDAVTGSGQVPLISSQAAADAIRMNASNAAGGIDIDAGTGGIAVDTAGALSLDAAAASNLSTATGALTLSSTDGTVAGVVNIASSGTGASAVDIDSSGGIDIDYAAASTTSVASGGTVIATFGTAAAPDLTVNNGHLSLSTAGRGIQIAPDSPTVIADAVTTNGTVGIITDSGTVASGSRASIAVTNTSVGAASQIFIHVTDDATAAQTASLLTSVNTIAAGSYILNVFNSDGANATAGTPSYHYLIINPV